VGAPDGSATKTQESTEKKLGSLLDSFFFSYATSIMPAWLNEFSFFASAKSIMPAWLNVLLLDLARQKEGQLQPCLSRGQQVQDCTSAAVSATIW
jgi:hypothetical protein